MNYQPIVQMSPEWWNLKVGKVSGTRYGQVISGRKNNLVYELINENLNGYIEPDDFVSDDMQFGIENETKALDLYETKTGYIFERGGVILSDFNPIHMASPDGVNRAFGIVAEVKCTQHGARQIKRFFEGPEPDYPPQIKNYFAVSDDVKEVHWISFCPYRQERELVVHIYKRGDVAGYVKTKVNKETVETPYTIHDEAIEGRKLIELLQSDLITKQQQFIF